MTATEISHTLKLTPSVISAKCSILSTQGFLERSQKFNPTSGKMPWFYKTTRKGRRYLSLKNQLKALFNHE